MRKYTTFAELETLLLTAINIPGSSIKDIAAATGIKANTLYKWKITPIHLSPVKADKLLLYEKYEIGELNIRISVLIALKKIYSCSYDDFFEGLDEESE